MRDKEGTNQIRVLDEAIDYCYSDSGSPARFVPGAGSVNAYDRVDLSVSRMLDELQLLDRRFDVVSHSPLTNFIPESCGVYHCSK